jgi:hypothetical protein
MKLVYALIFAKINFKTMACQIAPDLVQVNRPTDVVHMHHIVSWRCPIRCRKSV